MKREYLVDLAKYQSSSVSAYKRAGATGAIIQVSVASSIVAPLAKAQARSAKSHGMKVMAYFYGCFGNSQTQAKREANFAVACAKKAGIPAGTYFGVDWEQQDNYVYGSPNANAKAIMAAMAVLKKAGYKPLCYSSASLLRNNINTHAIIKKYGTCLWVASYASMGVINVPNFNYFPSMNGVAIWQFTDNWHGLGVDGNISLIALNITKPKHKARKRPTLPAKGMFTINTALKLHKTAHITAPAIAKLPKGSVILYDKVIVGPLRTWIRQPRKHGYGYLVAVDKNKKLLGKVI